MKFALAILAAASLVAADDWSQPAASSSAAPSTASAASGNYSSSAYGSNSTGNGTASAAAPAYTAPAAAIPSSASQGCKSFLTDFNNAPSIQSCLAPALAAVNVKTPSLTAFCSAASSQGCSTTTMRMWLTYFSGNCSAELVTNPVPAVQSIYDSMYVALPLSNAVCAKDTAGNFCLSQPAGSGSGGSGVSNAAQQPLSATDGTPDADAFSAAHILFIGASPNMTSTDLCTECTKSIMSSYFAFESTTAYTGGLASSSLLGPQNALYSAIATTCGADFLSGALDNAGSSPSSLGNTANGAITYSASKGLAALIAVAAGFMAL